MSVRSRFPIWMIGLGWFIGTLAALRAVDSMLQLLANR